MVLAVEMAVVVSLVGVSASNCRKTYPRDTEVMLCARRCCEREGEGGSDRVCEGVIFFVCEGESNGVGIYSLSYFQCHSIAISNLNFSDLFSTESGRRDLEH